MAASQSTASFENYLSSFGSLIDSVLDNQIRRVDQVVRRHSLACCEHEDEFGCGELGTITDRDSERNYCPKHYRMIELASALKKLEVQS